MFGKNPNADRLGSNVSINGINLGLDGYHEAATYNAVQRCQRGQEKEEEEGQQ